jgi:molybdopterin synthase sulfur carrier subunit
MPRISFTENLRRHLPAPPVSADGATVREALDAVFRDNAHLKTYILDDQDRLRKHVTVFVNGGMITDRSRLSDAVTANDEIFVFQALSGG